MSHTEPPTDTATLRLADAFTKTRDEANRSLVRMMTIVAAVALSAVYAHTVWTAIDPRPEPILNWVESSSSTAISGAILGFSLALSGLAAVAVWTARITVRRSADPSRSPWIRILYSAALVAGLCAGLTSDPFIHIWGLSLILFLVQWLEARLHEERLQSHDSVPA